MIASINDHVLLQRDLDSLADWCYIWKLRLNKNKCFSITYSRSAIVSSTYFIGDHLIELVSSHRDLGITTSQDFTWSLHYDKICKAAFGSLQLIRRNISASHSVSVKRLLYITLVRSHFAYCSQLWRPNLLKDISRLERVQRKATKFILSDYLSCYKSRLLALNLLPLMYWLELQDMMFLIKLLKEPAYNFNILDYISFSTTSTRSGSTRKLKFKICKSNLSRHYYFN